MNMSPICSDQDSLPSSAIRLAALLAKFNVELHEILEIVSLDETLTARLIKAANSAASATRMPIKTIKEAVVRLGNARVLALASEPGAARVESETKRDAKRDDRRVTSSIPKVHPRNRAA